MKGFRMREPFWPLPATTTIERRRRAGCSPRAPAPPRPRSSGRGRPRHPAIGHDVEAAASSPRSSPAPAARLDARDPVDGLALRLEHVVEAGLDQRAWSSVSRHAWCRKHHQLPARRSPRSVPAAPAAPSCPDRRVRQARRDPVQGRVRLVVVDGDQRINTFAHRLPTGARPCVASATSGPCVGLPLSRSEARARASSEAIRSSRNASSSSNRASRSPAAASKARRRGYSPMRC